MIQFFFSKKCRSQRNYNFLLGNPRIWRDFRILKIENTLVTIGATSTTIDTNLKTVDNRTFKYLLMAIFLGAL